MNVHENTIFINGILQRSGTNYLNQTLLLHPDCFQPSVKIRENWFLHFSDSLSEYVSSLLSTWSNPQWQGDEYDASALYRAMGDSLLQFLVTQSVPSNASRLLAKTPSVACLERFPDFFGNSKLLIIVRDPRDVAASALNSWQVPVKVTLDNWRAAALNIVRFEAENPTAPYLVIRYEDLVESLEETTRTCLRFLELKEQSFPWSRMGSLPVFGSSESRKWQVTEAGPTFQPIGRWESLPSRARKALLRHRLPEMEYFGYQYGSGASRLALPSTSQRLQMALANSVEKTFVLARRGNYRLNELKRAFNSLVKAVIGEKLTEAAKRKKRFE